MSKENAGLLAYLAGLRETIGRLPVVAQRVEEQRVAEEYTWEDLPVTGMTVDEGDGCICLVRPDKELAEGPALNVDGFYSALRTALERHPGFTIVVSVWFRVDEEHTAGAHLPLESVEVDGEAKVLRLRF